MALGALAVEVERLEALPVPRRLVAVLAEIELRLPDRLQMLAVGEGQPLVLHDPRFHQRELRMLCQGKKMAGRAAAIVHAQHRSIAAHVLVVASRAFDGDRLRDPDRVLRPEPDVAGVLEAVGAEGIVAPLAAHVRHLRRVAVGAQALEGSVRARERPRRGGGLGAPHDQEAEQDREAERDRKRNRVELQPARWEDIAVRLRGRPRRDQARHRGYPLIPITGRRVPSRCGRASGRRGEPKGARGRRPSRAGSSAENTARRARASR